MLSFLETADHQIINPVYSATPLWWGLTFTQEKYFKFAIEDVYILPPYRFKLSQVREIE